MSPSASVAVARHRQAPDRTTARRPALEVVGRQDRLKRRRRAALGVALVLVVGSLLAVVLGHAMLAQAQVRLSNVQAALSAEQTAHRQEVLALAQAETPSRVAHEAQQRLHMARPAEVSQVPFVPLGTPVPTPTVAAAPAKAAPASTGVGTSGVVAGAVPTTTVPSSAGSSSAPAGSDPPPTPTGTEASVSVPGQ